jgi:cell wall-associated NlpC family hydrolase
MILIFQTFSPQTYRPMQPLTLTQTCARAAASMLIGLMMTAASGAFADEVNNSSQNAGNSIFSSPKAANDIYPVAGSGNVTSTSSTTPSASSTGGTRSFLSGMASKAGDVVVGALNMIGVRYRWGGNTPDSGLDCSGFVRYVFQDTLGMTLPRRAEEMSRVGEKVRVSELKPGDLVFFNTMRRSFSHVGIYIGDNKFVHSPSTGSTIRVDDMDNSYWEKRYTGARRIEATFPIDGVDLRQRVSATIGGNADN